MEFAITFAAGASYGLTTVVVGQPLDTIKTRMQGLPTASKHSMLHVGKDLFLREGVRGLYRGGLPLVVGGSMMRSAQFGVSGKVSDLLNHSNLPNYKLFGIFNYKVLLAGVAGGIGAVIVGLGVDHHRRPIAVEDRS